MSAASVEHPPLPPPPPPPPTPSSSIIRKSLSEHLICPSAVELLSKACHGKFSSEITPQFVASFRPSVPCIQDGPSCGFSALSIVANSCRQDLRADIAKVLRECQLRGVTQLGEMYSAGTLATIAKRHNLVSTASVVHIDSSTHYSAINAVVKHLWNTGPALVPYDCDKNFEPLDLRGHKAHWAALLGILLPLPPSSSLDNFETVLPGLHYCQRPNDDILSPSFMDCFESANTFINYVYVLAMQGKSSRVHVWKLSDLLRSNLQLREVGNVRQEQLGVTDNDVVEGLCGKVILCQPFE